MTVNNQSIGAIEAIKPIDTCTLIINEHAEDTLSDTPLSLTYYHSPYHSPKGKLQSAQAPALVFLHGILGDGRTWAPILKEFPEFEAYALTQSGFGEMNEGQEDISVDTLFDTDRHADELIAFCTALNTQENRPHRPFIIVAWSYACHVALLAAQKMMQTSPKLFKSIICYELIVPSYGMNENDQTRFTRDITKMMSPIIKAYRRNEPLIAVDAFIAACKNSPNQNDYSLSQQSARIQSIKHDNIHTLAKLLHQKEPRNISADDLAEIHRTTPITILCGENSRGIFQLASKAGANAIDQASWIVENADHLLPEENPLRFSQEIKTILGLQ